MYAIIRTGGKQYRVSEGDEVVVEKLKGEEGDTIEISEVLAVKDGDEFLIGKPYLEDTTVKTKIVEHGFGDNIIVFKYKPKKGYRRRQNHRQPYTKLLIEQIGNGSNNETQETIVETEIPETVTEETTDVTVEAQNASPEVLEETPVEKVEVDVVEIQDGDVEIDIVEVEETID